MRIGLFLTFGNSEMLIVESFGGWLWCKNQILELEVGHCVQLCEEAEHQKMAWGAKCGYSFQGGNEGFGMGLVRSSSFGRKRIALTSTDIMEIDCFDETPIKRQCSSEASFFTLDKSRLEELPQEVLIKIVCGVDHDDLKMLFFVSKSIREATVIAKDSHFVYKTPRKKIGFPNSIDLDDSNEFNEVERAPKQVRIHKSKLNSKKLSDISVALFSRDGEEKWPRRDLFIGMETEL